MFVPITLRRIRGRAERDTKRGPTMSATIGPIPNITMDYERGDTPSVPAQGSAVYSATVSARTSPPPRRSRSPDVAWWIACSCRQRRNGE
jgi:hypothetical protein